MNIQRLFPSLLGTSINPNHNDSLVSRCLDIQSSTQSGGTNWVSKDTYNTMGSHDILQDENFKPVNDFVMDSVREYCREIKVNTNEIYPEEAWFNLYKKGDYQEYHNHNPHFLSAIYYLKTPKVGSKLFMKSPLNDMIAPNYLKRNIDNTSRQVIQPEDGLFLIFRSHIEHCVEKHTNDEPRISLAYNFSYRA